MVKTEARRANVEVLEKEGLTSRERAFWAISRNMHSPPLGLVGEEVLSMSPWYTNGEIPNLAMVNRKDLISAWLVSNKTYNLRLERTRIESFNTDGRYIERLSGENREWNCFVDNLLMSDPLKAVVSIAEVDEGDAEQMGMKYAVVFEFKKGEISLGTAQRHSWRIGTHFEDEAEEMLFLNSLGEVLEGPNKRKFVSVLQKEALLNLIKKIHGFKRYEDWEYEILEKSFKFQLEHESIKAIVDPISFYRIEEVDEQGRAYGIDHRTGKRVLIANVFTNGAGRADWLLREREIKNFGYSRRRVAGGSISSVTAGDQEVEEIIDIIQRDADGSVTHFALKMAKGVPIALREEIYEHLEQNPFLNPKDLSLFIVSKIDEMPENVREELSVFKEGVLKGMESYEAFRGEVKVGIGQREVVRNILPEFRRENDLFLGREILERRALVPLDEILKWRKVEEVEIIRNVVAGRREIDLRGSTSVFSDEKRVNEEREAVEKTLPVVFLGEISYWEYVEEARPVVPEGPGGGEVEITNYGLRSHDGVNTVEKLGNTKVAEQTGGIKGFGREEEQALDRVTYVRHFVSGERVYKVDKIMLEHDFVNEGKGNNFESASVFTGTTHGFEVRNEESAGIAESAEKKDVTHELALESTERVDKKMLEHGFVNERESEGEFSDVTPRGSSFDSFGYAQDRFAQDHLRGVPFSEVSLPPCDLRGLNIGERKKWENIVLINNLPIGEFVDLRMLFIDLFNLRMILGGISTAPVLAMDEGELWMVEKGKRLIRDLTKNGAVYLSTILLILVPAILYWIGNFEQVLV